MSYRMYLLHILQYFPPDDEQTYTHECILYMIPGMHPDILRVGSCKIRWLSDCTARNKRTMNSETQRVTQHHTDNLKKKKHSSYENNDISRLAPREKSSKPVVSMLAKRSGHKKEATIVQQNTKIGMKFSILVACLLGYKVSNKKTILCDMLILAEFQHIDVSQVFL